MHHLKICVRLQHVSFDSTFQPLVSELPSGVRVDLAARRGSLLVSSGLFWVSWGVFPSSGVFWIPFGVFWCLWAPKNVTAALMVYAAVTFLGLLGVLEGSFRDPFWFLDPCWRRFGPLLVPLGCLGGSFRRLVGSFGSLLESFVVLGTLWWSFLPSEFLLASLGGPLR